MPYSLLRIRLGRKFLHVVTVYAFGESVVDKVSCSYRVFWNACKLLAKGASNAEKVDLVAGTAARFYRLNANG